MKETLLKSSSGQRQIFILILLFVITLLFMLPRLLSPQFGLLDDGMSIITSQAFFNNPVVIFLNQIQSGRTIPTYWFFMATTLRLTQYSPLGAYIIKWIMLYLTIILFFNFLQWRGLSILSSFLCCILFIFSAPSIENYYTFSKAEPIMIFWILLGFYFVTLSTKVKNRYYQIFLYVIAGFSFVLAFFTKETSVVMLAISFVWIISAWIWKTPSITNHQYRDKMNFFSTVIIFFVFLISFIIWIVSRQQILGNLIQKGYSAYYQISPNSLFIQGWKWIGYFIRDYFYLLPLSILLFFSSIRKNLNVRLLFDSFFWMAAWTLIFLPWKALDMYYTLPFSLGVSIAGGHLLSVLVQKIIKGVDNCKKYFQTIISVFLILSTIFISIGLINSSTQARIQLLIDRTNESMVSQLANLETNDPIFVNSPPIEYINETRIHLSQIYDRENLVVDILDFTHLLTDHRDQFWVLTPIVDKMPLPSVRSSLQNEPGVKQWNLCIKDLVSSQSLSKKRIVEKMTWMDIGFNRFLPNLGLPDPLSNQMYNQILLNKQMEYGWEIYHVQVDKTGLSLPGSFDQGLWNLTHQDGKTTQTPFGLSGDFPLVGDFDGNGKSDLGVYRAITNEFFMDINLDGKYDLTIIILDMKKDDYPIVGDWNGDGVDTLGFFRRSDATWNLLSENKSKNTTEQYSIIGVNPNALPLVGDWDGDGFDTFGIYIANEGVFVFDDVINPDNGFSQRINLPTSSQIIVGNWFGIGIDTLAVVKNDEWTFFPTNINCDYPNPLPVINKSELRGVPIVGVWDKTK